MRSRVRMPNATFGSLTRRSRRFLYSLLRKKALIMSAILVFIQLLTPVATIYAADTVSNDIGSAASLDPVGNKATRLQSQGSSGVDQSSGALTYTYPLTLPDGRNGMTPKLSLSYNSQNNDSGWFGYGWTISIPYVERTTKTGSDKMYSNPAFISSLHGELVSSNGVNYEQKVDDGSYPKYTYTGNTWQMTDRDGTTYYFGNTYNSRIQDDSGVLIGRWYLTEVRDKFGNGILYSYVKDSGTVYPSSISYTEHAMAHPLNLVTFTLENKLDQLSSYKYGFKTTDTKRVSATKVSTNGKDSAYFYFTYITGSNGTRSLLQGIEEKHLSTNGDWTTLPKTTFDYEKSAPNFSGTISNSVSPYGTNVVMDTDNNGILELYNAGDGYFPIEINGDYKKDLVQAEVTYGAYSSGHYVNYKYNQGSSTFLLRSLKKPTSPAYLRAMIMDDPIPALRIMGEGEWWWSQESVVTDVNGDGFDDVVYNDRYGNNGVGINTTNNTFDYSTSTNFWFNIGTDQLADVNGDGLQDKISRSASGTTTYSIYLNTGSGYSTSTYYVYNTGLNSPYEAGVRFVDINNDGLPDIVRSYNSNYAGTSGSCPGGTFPTTAPVDQSVNTVLINTGNSFVSTSSPLSGYLVTYSKCTDGFGNPYTLQKNTKEYDTDGDLDTDYDGATNNTKKQDILTKVTSPLGSTLDVSYSWTTASGLNPTLPVPMYTVGTTTEKLSPSDSTPHVVSYSFQDGQMYFDDSAPRDHKFAGFGKVEVVDGNKKTVTYFHQGNGDNPSTGEKGDSYYNIGRSYRTDTFDLSSGTSTLVSQDLSLYTTYSYASSSFTYLDSQIKNLYNSDGSYVSSASRNVYDETKRLIKTSYNYGDIEPFISFASSTITDKGSDLTVTSYIYSNTRPQRLVKQTTADYSGQTIGNTVYYYDGLPYGLVDKGAVTTTLDTIYNSDGTVNATSSTQVEYDPMGNVTKTTDALGNITKVSYDSSYYFPIQKVDALNGTTTYSYDPYTLNLLSTKGPDGITYVKEVDGLGKVTRSYTLDSGGGVHDEARINYVYGGGLTVYTRKMGSSGQEARSVDIYDSYGRLIQSKKESTIDSFSTQDTTYDASSNVTSVSLPYITTGYGYTSGTPANGKTIYTYDGLGRVTAKEAFGSKVTYQYGARSLTIQDNASTQHKKTYTYDANGNLATVQEYNNGNTYTTTYSYTPTNNLSRITDANGNIRNFNYLSNGLLTYQEDSHPSSDSTFTTYSYTYDSLGNLLSKTGPLGSISYSYDALNRPTTRTVSDSANGTSTVSLTYTGCVNNYISPCTINRGTSSTTLTYNSYGKLGSEMLSIDGKTYTRSYAYDTFSNPTTITYPDNGQAVYSYTLDGKQASLSYITPSGSTKSIVSNTTFNSMGDLSSYSLGNGIQLCNTYTTTSTDGVISPKLGKSVYLFNSTGCSLSGSNQVELYKDEFTYKDYMTPSNILTTYKDIAGTTHTKSDSFTYDNLARLTQTSTSYDGGGALVDSLVYDPIGNIISENNVLYRYSKDGMQNANAVTSIGGVNVSYDSQGNRIQSGDNSYAWNTLNQLVLATSTNGTERYTYDENGERLKKVVQASALVNQKVSPSTTGLAISTLSQGDLLAQVATSSTYIATSTYNTLSSLSLLDKTSLLNLVTGYYASPFTSKFCAATSTANRQTCISDTTKQLLANDINQRSTSTVATAGLITDIIKISTGEYLIPSSYVGIATSSIATSSQATFTVNSGTISSYNTYVATGIVVALDQYSNLPYVSTSTYNTLALLGLTDTTKVKTVMILAGCNSVVSACTNAKKVIFEKYYKESGYLLSDRALQEMWYVYAAKARLPGNSTELTSTSTYLGNITVPSVTSRSSSSATSTYYSGLYFTTEYSNQNSDEPRLQYFNTIPYYITSTAFTELQAAGITQTTVESYQSQIDDLLGIKYASSTEYMVSLQSFAKNDKGITLSWSTLKELYLVVIGAASIPNNIGDYTQNAVYDLSNHLIINSYRTVNSQFTLQWTTACNGGYVASIPSPSRCVIGTSPFSLTVSTSTTVNYILSIKNSPSPTESSLLMGPSTNTTIGTDSHNYSTDLPYIFNSYYIQNLSSDGIRIDTNVTPTILTQQASSTSPLKILIMNDAQWGSTTYPWEAVAVTLKAYADTPRLTLASTTLVSGITNATTTSFTAGIQNTIAAYFGENHDSSFDISTGTTSPLVFISPESYREFASTTLKDAYQITKVFMATSTTQCASAASTTECDKTLRKAAFREIVTNLSGFTPSQAATEEFWMVHKGILTLPNISFASSTATTTINGYYQATSTNGAWVIQLSPGYYSTDYTATSTASTTVSIVNSQLGGTTFAPGSGSQYVIASCASYCDTPSFNGVAMTQLARQVAPSTNTDLRLYGIATTTSNSVSVTSNCGTYCGNATDHYKWISLKGLNTSNYYYDVQGGAGNSNQFSSLSVSENIQDKNNKVFVTSNTGTASSPLTATSISNIWYHTATSVGSTTYTIGSYGSSEIEVISIQFNHDLADTITPGYYTTTYHATTTTYYVATSSAVLPAIVSSTSTPYPVFSRSNLPQTLATSTAYYTSTTTIPGFWVDQVAYADSPSGGATSTSGSYTVHTFNSSGTFTVPSGASFNAEVLAVGGGGGGGGSQGGGGGGGQVISSSTVAFTAGTYSVTIGAGGTGGDAGATVSGGNGATTTFAGLVSKGGKGAPRPTNLNGGDSGSGKTGGTGILSGYYPSGGGAGDFANGVNGTGSTSGNGGTGTSSSITGTSLGYGGGGGGGGDSQGSTAGSGVDGGGNGATAFVNSPGSSGAANRGGGGGGGSNDNGCHCAGTAGGDGSSGVVIVRYLTSLFPYSATTTIRVYIATSTLVAPVTHLDLVPAGLLSDEQFNLTYATSGFALASTTLGISQDTYNELLKTPVRINSDVKTVFAYALPFATSSCPGQAATSSCVITAQKTKVKDSVSALSGFILSDAALEELYRVNNGDLSIIPMSLANAATSSSNQTIILPLDTSRALTSYSTSTASGTTTTSVGNICSFGTNGATTTMCRIGLPDLNTSIDTATFKYDLSTSTVATSSIKLNFTYWTQVASTTGATSTPQFTSVSSSTTVIGQKSGTSTFSFDLSSYYKDFITATTSAFVLTPDANGTSTQVFQALNPVLTFNRYISNQSITYATTTQFIPFDRSTIPSYATTTATTSIDLTNTPPIELSMMFSPEAGAFILNSTPSTYLVGNTGMVAYYKLDGNSNDAAGSTNGSDTNITYSSGNGKLNNGAGFNGTNSTVALGTGLNLAGGGMTIAGWVYINTNSLYQEAILDKRDVGGTMQYQFYVENSAAKLAFYTGTQYNSTSAVGSNGWHHVAVTLSNSSNGNLTFYIDGVQSGTASSVNLGSGTSARVAIGSQGSADYDFFHGAIDELGVWSRALSSAEIANLYNSGSGLAYPFATTGSSRQESYAGYTPDDSYLYSTSTQNILPAVSYPYATSSLATSTINTLTVATTTQYTVYTPFSSYQDDSRGTVTTYLTLNGNLVGTYTYQKGNEASTGKVTYLLTNYLGTPVITTDEHGDIVEMDMADVFGNYVQRDVRKDNAEHTRGFTNQDFDDVTGLNYFHARYLDTKAHSFISVDPMLYKLPQSYLLDPQQMNSYAYARNNPAIYNDPTGKCIGPLVVVCAEAAITIGAAILAALPTITQVINAILPQLPAVVSISANAIQQGNQATNPVSKVINYAGAIPIIPAVGSTANIASKGAQIASESKPAIQTGVSLAEQMGSKSFSSFDALKAAARKEFNVPEGIQFHHNVEQRNATKFGNDFIQSTDNVIPLSVGEHKEVSRFYSSRFTDPVTGQTFSQYRNYLEQFDLETHVDEGRRILKELLDY